MFIFSFLSNTKRQFIASTSLNTVYQIWGHLACHNRCDFIPNNHRLELSCENGLKSSHDMFILKMFMTKVWIYRCMMYLIFKMRYQKKVYFGIFRYNETYLQA